MSGKLLDTNVVINGIKGIDSARKFLLKFENEYRVSSVTLGELLFGAEKSHLSETNKNTYLSFCNFVGVIDIDSKIAQSYGKINKPRRRASAYVVLIRCCCRVLYPLLRRRASGY